MSFMKRNIIILIQHVEKEASSEDLSNSDITTWDQAEPTTQEANEYRAYCDKILFGI